ncbi:RNA 2'-phosphotransferase [Spirosoma linguale]|uniref:Probable RNA 2'-phosphotransferase n=1 Tax=Spirosoma linguale (strain ATCC 33905 / DSM 74 / LMG 10896 / Claus 1) TaxID=504472 RepID=D2QIW0_SPILD|nr:phosphotransferase KptA/Tpt1 [Spirosoma linguale DSM 74]
MIIDSEAKRISKLLSLALRHKPETTGIILDKNGWTDVDLLIAKLQAQSYPVNFEQLCYIVDTNNKSRFAFNNDKSKIRANQGHSVEVDLGYMTEEPPHFLYHGTATRFINQIIIEGLKKMSRHHVHLSADELTALRVGERHGEPIVLTVKAKEMAANGHVFHRSENGIWLTDFVPPSYLIYE